MERNKERKKELKKERKVGQPNPRFCGNAWLVGWHEVDRGRRIERKPNRFFVTFSTFNSNENWNLINVILSSIDLTFGLENTAI